MADAVTFHYGRSPTLNEDGEQDTRDNWYLTADGLSVLDILDIYHNEYGSFEFEGVTSTIYQLTGAGYRVMFEPRTNPQPTPKDSR